MIDLRSDTVTKPTDAMRAVMATAEVGDDVYGDDPTVRALEARTAELLGKEDAVFVPTGSMSNQIAIRTHTEPGDLVLIDRAAHIIRAEGGAAAALSGVTMKPLVGSGGIFGADDLADYQATWQEPISIEYRGYRIHTPPPNSSGFQILQTLKLMDGLEAPDMVFQHPATLHYFMESVKLSVADRIKYAGDPDYVSAPLDALLSDGYAKQQAALIDRDTPAIVAGERYAEERPEGALKPGSPEAFDGGMTTHFAVADRDGNVVSVTQTLGGGFGSGAAVGGTGVFLNNMASYFELDDGSPNRIGPGKRVDFVVAPTQTFRDGRFYLSIGTPGSWGILQTTPQMIVNVLDHGMNIQEAIEAPRLSLDADPSFYMPGAAVRVRVESRVAPLVISRLVEMGHDAQAVREYSIGSMQGIVRNPETGTMMAGADPRRMMYAIGW